MQPQRSWKISQDRNPSPPEPDSPSEASVLKEMKKWPCTLQSEATKPMKFSKEDSKSRTDNSEKPISLIQVESIIIKEILVSVFKSTSIWVLSMTLTLVFSVWTSTLSSKDQETESALEEDANQESELNTESTKKRPCNGSDVNTMVPSTTDKFTYLNNISILMQDL